jgi:predicted NAD-dependent protein-ADP-ribosyltransferase YbiA (DUF1768 family)
MGLFSVSNVNTIYISRYDEVDLLSSYSKHDFEPEECRWHTVEHYYQSMKFADFEYREKIHNSELGHDRKQQQLKDWKKNRMLMMIRAIYTECKACSHN